MVGVSASVSLPLHHKVQKFSSGTGSPGWSQKKGHETVVVVSYNRVTLSTLTPLDCWQKGHCSIYASFLPSAPVQF